MKILQAKKQTQGAARSTQSLARVAARSAAQSRSRSATIRSGRAPSSESRGDGYDWAPFLSVSFLIVALFSVVLCKMEMRRMGYSVLKLTREERSMRDQQREQMIQLARMTRPERLQAVAQARLTLKKAESGQIIQMTQQGVALKQ